MERGGERKESEIEKVKRGEERNQKRKEGRKESRKEREYEEERGEIGGKKEPSLLPLYFTFPCSLPPLSFHSLTDGTPRYGAWPGA